MRGVFTSHILYILHLCCLLFCFFKFWSLINSSALWLDLMMIFVVVVLVAADVDDTFLFLCWWNFHLDYFLYATWIFFNHIINWRMYVCVALAAFRFVVDFFIIIVFTTGAAAAAALTVPLLLPLHRRCERAHIRAIYILRYYVNVLFVFVIKMRWLRTTQT